MASISSEAPKHTVSEIFAEKLSGVEYENLPEKARTIAVNDFLDMAGCCIAARESEYINQLSKGCISSGNCTALGQPFAFDVRGAALINGVATHGEDFDDTLEGAPIRVGAMVIPAILAAAEYYALSGRQFLLGVTVGLETICRMNHVAAGEMHKHCFHPVGVVGPFGAAAGVCAALGLDKKMTSNALAISASLSSGIIEYLADGAWTKRLHPGWAAQSGLSAALFAAQGFNGPRTIFEGEHNYFKAYARTAIPKYEYLTEDVGEKWMMEDIVFKPYACGTMIHPYIDCMIRLSKDGVNPDDIVDIECDTGEGLVHRLWEPLADKQTPPTGYAAKFSMPWCMAIGFFEHDAGLEQFADEKVHYPDVLKLAGKIRYKIDPENEYPRNYSGHIRVKMKDGQVIEKHQPHMRGGSREPLSREELVAKFYSNAIFGGWSERMSRRLSDFCLAVETVEDMSQVRAFRM